jgi:hypothetical protein
MEPLFMAALISLTVRCNRYQASVLPKHLALFLHHPLTACGCAVRGRGTSELTIQADPDAEEPLYTFTLNLELHHLPGLVIEPNEETLGDNMQELLAGFARRELMKSFRWTFESITVEQVTLSPWLSAIGRH